MKDLRESDSRADLALLYRDASGVGDTIELWKTTFDDPFPLRLRVITEDGESAEAWLNPVMAGEFARILAAQEAQEVGR